MVIAHNPHDGSGYPLAVTPLPSTVHFARFRPNHHVRAYVSNKQSGCACPHLKAVISAGCIAQTQECWVLRRPGFFGTRLREFRIVTMRRYSTNMSQVRRSQEVVTDSTRKAAVSIQQSAFSAARVVKVFWQSRAGPESSGFI